MGNYNNGEDVVRVINEDCTGRKLMRKTANANDAESVKDAFTAVIEKYGLDIEVIPIKRVKNPWVEKSDDFSWK